MPKLWDVKQLEATISAMEESPGLTSHHPVAVLSTEAKTELWGSRYETHPGGDQTAQFI